MDRAVYKYISKQTQDPIIKWRTCKRTGEEFPIFQGDIDMLDKLSPVIVGKKYQLPLPTLSPRARQIRRLVWRNESHLYRNKSSIDGKDTISLYHPDQGYKIIGAEAWTDLDQRGDLSYDTFSFDKMNELIKSTYHLSTSVLRMENSDFTNQASDLKNCYLIFASGQDEDCMYGRRMHYSKNCIDCLGVYECQNCYECIKCEKSYKLFFCINVLNSNQCRFSSYCQNCEYCFGCSNLVNKKYYRYDKQLSKEEYISKFEQAKKEIKSFQGLQGFIQKWKNDNYARANIILQSTNAYGNYISMSKNILLCWDIIHGEDLRYCNDVLEAKDLMDVSFFGQGGLERSYEGSVIGLNGANLYCCTDCRDNVHDLYYCHLCAIGTHDCFACSGLVNRSYCIFNKQYSKEDYKKEVGRIIGRMIETLLKTEQAGEWGEFFPPKLSPLPYNDTMAYDYFPIKKIIHINGKEEIVNPDGSGVVSVQEDKFISYAILDLGGEEKIKIKWRTREHEVDIPEGMEKIEASELDNNPLDKGGLGSTAEGGFVQSHILNKAILCSKSGRPYRLLKQELRFYRDMGLPLPRLHWAVRNQERMKMRDFRDLYMRTCDKPAKDGSRTGKEIISVYPPDTPFEVYSEGVYQREIFG